ncbi:hypothetical protein HGH92_32370 [Chitinophaga varians]|uniref:Uncharacterized protein n=1 Tax=Chitinophaga varians TaxID=2202339 RepID=A0A847RTX3_9BACT|nr:hypothetical protein [Chitinophaga varians]NLR69040.1 hypothetical protein [Chitinophaga varians]
MMNARFRIHLAHIFLFLLAVVFSTGCSKELSREGAGTGPVVPPADLATYGLEHQGNSCSDAVVTGTFKVGTTAAGSKIQVTVQVAIPGVWTLTTGNVNGIEFSGGGSFSATGKYTITLIASGTPQQEGTFNFPLKTTGSSCSVAVKVSGSGPDVPPPPADFYYKLTANGKDYEQDVATANNYMLTSETTGGTDVTMGSGIAWAGGNNLPQGKTELLMSKGKLTNFDAVTNQDFKTFFQPGNYGYAAVNNQTLTDGLLLVWTDENGKNWSTLNGATGQPNGTFTIVSTEDWAGYAGYYGVKVKMRFTCKFYDDAGASLDITNGEMVGGFVKKR